MQYKAKIESINQENNQIVKNKPVPKESFDQVFKEIQKSSDVTFSKHAAERIAQRDIVLSSEDMQKLNSAVESAEVKGIKDSLIIMNSKAFIVNISSGVVVTVLDSSDIGEQKVFTNIDGAVMI